MDEVERNAAEFQIKIARSTVVALRSRGFHESAMVLERTAQLAETMLNRALPPVTNDERNGNV